MVKNIYDTGDQFAKKGTTGWANWQRSRMKHALEDVHFEARQIVQVIRDMCAGDRPAWHLMTRPDGVGFRTFEEFVTSPDGLVYPDYPKFKSVAVSERGIMNEREYDLLTAAPIPTPEEAGKRKGSAPGADPLMSIRRVAQLRAVNRADAFVRKLYVAGLIDAKLAELLGPDEKVKDGPERKAKAERALGAIRAIGKNGDDAAYRAKVNAAVREAFARGKPTTLDGLRKLWAKATAKERARFLKEVGE